jgi:predicted lipoprotein with Yx(FWY)xxD motif
VDAKGMTLYVFDKDTGTTSACTAGCAKAWPPAAATGSPTAGTGVDQSKVGTTKRDDGTTQITYAGHPLYTFAGDAKAGDASGQGTGGIWWVVGPDGTKIEKKA